MDWTTISTKNISDKIGTFFRYWVPLITNAILFFIPAKKNGAAQKRRHENF